jgi:hypothetical protein
MGQGRALARDRSDPQPRAAASWRRAWRGRARTYPLRHPSTLAFPPPHPLLSFGASRGPWICGRCAARTGWLASLGRGQPHGRPKRAAHRVAHPFPPFDHIPTGPTAGRIFLKILKVSAGRFASLRSLEGAQKIVSKINAVLGRGANSRVRRGANSRVRRGANCGSYFWNCGS